MFSCSWQIEIIYFTIQNSKLNNMVPENWYPDFDFLWILGMYCIKCSWSLFGPTTLTFYLPLGKMSLCYKNKEDNFFLWMVICHIPETSDTFSVNTTKPQLNIFLFATKPISWNFRTGSSIQVWDTLLSRCNSLNAVTGVLTLSLFWKYQQFQFLHTQRKNKHIKT